VATIPAADPESNSIATLDRPSPFLVSEFVTMGEVLGMERAVVVLLRLLWATGTANKALAFIKIILQSSRAYFTLRG